MEYRKLAAAVLTTYTLSLMSNALLARVVPSLQMPFLAANAETVPANYSFTLAGVFTEEGGAPKNAKMQGTIALLPGGGTTVTAAAPTTSVSPAPASAPSAQAAIEIWWPVDGVTVAATQPFKALVPGRALSDYAMYWQVDQGQLNPMPDNFTDAPHKEAAADLSAWTWRGSGPYSVTFVAKDRAGAVIALRTITLYVANGLPRQTAVAPAASAVPTVIASVPAPTQTALSAVPSSNPLQGRPLWVPSTSAQSWVLANRIARPADAALIDSKIASQPQAMWLGDWNADIRNDVAAAMNQASQKGALPVFVLYNIPLRDCGGFSAGGAQTPGAYQTWISAIADAIANRPAAAILEPDGLSTMDCLAASDKTARLAMLRSAAQTLSARGVAVYIDAGHPAWIAVPEMANRLKNAGIGQARGFALNVSNFYTDASNAAYGAELSALVGGKPFVVDRSRNGNGPSPDNQWCNPPGRALGLPPTANTGNARIDGYLWLKTPGESDGFCNGGPSAGAFWPVYALGLAQRAGW